MADDGDEGRGKAAISLGEPQVGIDPGISEWGNPRRGTVLRTSESIAGVSEPREVNHLSTWRKRKQPRFRK